MSLNSQPSGERLHIGIFGRANVGKSSLINALTNQDLAIVSEQAGTTTDPVRKSMELLPLGPIVLIDTPGLADETNLGDLRAKKTHEVLRQCDLAILVTDQAGALDPVEAGILNLAQPRIPVLIVRNKADLEAITADLTSTAGESDPLLISTRTGSGIDLLKTRIADLLKPVEHPRYLVQDLLSPGDLVVLVTPIDSSAPKGRLILPQQQVLRDVLDAEAIGICVQPNQLADLLLTLPRQPRLVITDSQAFAAVAAIVPREIPLLSFSVIFSRYKGDLDEQAKAALKIDELVDGDHILIAEACTHHRQCEDIGTVKLPRWLRDYSGRDLQFKTYSGGEFPEDLASYRLIIHCGACMLNASEMQYRLGYARNAGIPMTNFGTAIAYVNGILGRCLEGLTALTTRR